MEIISMYPSRCLGVLTVQTSRYYYAFPNDGRPVKLAVAVLWTLGAFQLACYTQSFYWWFVTNYHNPLAQQWLPWEFAIYSLNATCSSLIVQTFFAYRVYSLSGNLYLGVLVQGLVLLQFGFSAASCIKLFMIGLPQKPDSCKECDRLAEVWLIIQAIADLQVHHLCVTYCDIGAPGSRICIPPQF
ncbi:hypothetical protein BS47DRAFT_1385287 [Hydnum rufescens UP504]|uniref:Uncharacterized protein n=1 Tax=Hydnum rufescens UP504 TaxID=1448309 RepID=A0A9P6AJN5_9AGAM|nr:hypothetical protein BS47DRAFT_1385287 [Hydnum rufescens UP504]